MLNALRNLVSYFEESDKTEVNTPVRLRPVLKTIDALNTLPYAQSFILHICDSIFKTNDILSELLCKEFVSEYSNELLNISKDDKISYPDLLNFCRLKFRIFCRTKLENLQNKSDNELTQKILLNNTIAYKSVSNRRPKQEDRYFGVTDILNYSPNHDCLTKLTCQIPQSKKKQPAALFIGLFDGHNGPEASEHCHRLAPYLFSQLLQNELCRHGHFNYTEAFADLFYSLNLKLNGCRNRYRWRAGTTSTMCLVAHDVIITSWVGDSSAWLVFDRDSCTTYPDTPGPDQGHQIPLTDLLHRPTEPSEVVDVWNNGGLVTKSGNQFDRVNGILAVTRALGDDRKIKGVTALPSISQYTRVSANEHRSGELCIVLASDGLWDSIDPRGELLGSLCRQYLHGNDVESGLPKSQSISVRQQLCQALVDAAIQAGASDNITIVLVVLNTNPSDPVVANHQLHHSTNGSNQGILGHHHQDYRSIVRHRRQRHMSHFPEELSQLRQLSEPLTEYLQSHFHSDIRMLKSLRQRPTSSSSSVSSVTSNSNNKHNTNTKDPLATNMTTINDDDSDISVVRAANDLLCNDTTYKHHHRHDSSSLDNEQTYNNQHTNTSTSSNTHTINNNSSNVCAAVNNLVHTQSTQQIISRPKTTCIYRSNSLNSIYQRKQRYSSPIRIIKHPHSTSM